MTLSVGYAGRVSDFKTLANGCDENFWVSVTGCRQRAFWCVQGGMISTGHLVICDCGLTRGLS